MNTTIGKVTADISLFPENPENGEDFQVNITVSNKLKSEISVRVKSGVYSCYYTGRKVNVITRDDQDRTIRANSGKLYRIVSTDHCFNLEKTFSFNVRAYEYEHRFADGHMSFKIDSLVQIQGQHDITEDLDFQLENRKDLVDIEV